MYSLASNLIFKLVFCLTIISLQSFSPFPSTSVGPLGLFTFLPQCTAVHNLSISELGVPVYMFLGHNKQNTLYNYLILKQQ